MSGLHVCTCSRYIVQCTTVLNLTTHMNTNTHTPVQPANSCIYTHWLCTHMHTMCWREAYTCRGGTWSRVHKLGATFVEVLMVCLCTPQLLTTQSVHWYIPYVHVLSACMVFTQRAPSLWPVMFPNTSLTVCTINTAPSLPFSVIHVHVRTLPPPSLSAGTPPFLSSLSSPSL